MPSLTALLLVSFVAIVNVLTILLISQRTFKINTFSFFENNKLLLVCLLTFILLANYLSLFVNNKQNLIIDRFDNLSSNEKKIKDLYLTVYLCLVFIAFVIAVLFFCLGR